jgi:hypothetical protein
MPASLLTGAGEGAVSAGLTFRLLRKEVKLQSIVKC